MAAARKSPHSPGSLLLLPQLFSSEPVVFVLKEARACIFAGSFFTLLFLSNHIPLFGLPRYDFIFLVAVGIQIVLYLTKIETAEEVRFIFIFHIIGMGLELYKTSPAVGSWTYPEFSYLHIATVPLYSGFMYAAVGSFISQAWRIFEIEVTNYTRYLWSVLLCLAIYINFFIDTLYFDFRWILILIVFVFFWRTRVYVTIVEGVRRWIPLNIVFLGSAFFIWIAENISTFLGAWKYPNQARTWNLVSTGKISSWFLLVIICFIIVAYLKHFKRHV
jgi:uncharacterized membrane protein YoaT (DUF817 family)